MWALKEVDACRIFLPHCGNDHEEKKKKRVDRVSAETTAPRLWLYGYR